MPLPRTLAVAPLTLAAVLGASVAFADASRLPAEVGWNGGDIETARSLAVGGAVRALGGGTTSLYANPANLALQRVYHLEALASIGADARRQTYGAGAVDSVSGRLAGGIGGHYGFMDPDGIDRKWTDLRLGLAFPFSEKLYAGLSGRYLKLKQNGTGPLGSSYASGGLAGETMLESFSFDAGITLKPNEQFAIGVLGQNLTNPGTGFQPTMLGGGIGWGGSDLVLEADVLADFTTYADANGKSQAKMRAMGGLDYLAGDHYPVRLGYRWDQGLRTHAVSGGLGYVDPQFSLEVSMRRTVSGPETLTPSTTVVIGLQYFLESSGITRAPTDLE